MRTAAESIGQMKNAETRAHNGCNIPNNRQCHPTA